MAVESESSEGSGNTMLAVLIGAVLVVAVILFALGTFNSNPNSLTNEPSKIEITTPQPPAPTPAPAPAQPAPTNP